MDVPNHQCFTFKKLSNICKHKLIEKKTKNKKQIRNKNSIIHIIYICIMHNTLEVAREVTHTT